MKALLVKPKTFTSAKGEGFQIGLLYISTYINNFSNHRAEYYDMQLNSSHDDLLHYLGIGQFDIVGFTSNSHERFEVYKLAKKIRSALPQIKIVIGGPHHTILKEFPKDVPIDLYVFNDGEISLKKILDQLEDGSKDFSFIQDIAYYKEGAYIINPIVEINMQIDDISIIDWDLLKNPEKYHMILPIPGLPQIIPILTSRGCPYSCNFCAATRINYRRIRWMSPEAVVNEIEKVVNRFPDKILFIYDDHFLLNKERVFEIARLIKERNLNFKWGCYSRVDSIDDEVLDCIKKIGCVMITLGFESGSNKILKLMNKNVTSDQQISAVRSIKKAGIHPRCTLILNYPGETWIDFIKTLFTLHRSGLKYGDLSMARRLMIYPGTQIFEQFKDDYLPNGFVWDKQYPDIPHFRDVPIFDTNMIKINSFLKHLVFRIFKSFGIF